MPVTTYTVVQGEVIAENRGGVRKTYVPDPLGSTVAMVDDSGTITDTFTYWPYGEVKARTGSTPTPFQFVGSFGYYGDIGYRRYVRSRMFSSEHASWFSRDKHWPNQPSYMYCNGNPPTEIDPTGNVSVLGLLMYKLENVPVAPPGVNLWDNCCDAILRPGLVFLPNYWWFKDQVDTGKRWDYKRLDKRPGKKSIYEDFGNYHYGFVAACAGIDLELALIQAGRKQLATRTSSDEWQPRAGSYSLRRRLLNWFGLDPLLGWPYGDDPVDSRWIEKGYREALAMERRLITYCCDRIGVLPPQY